MQIWLEIRQPDETLEERTFVVYGTGRHVTDGDVYVGTVLDESFVWHLYERMKE